MKRILPFAFLVTALISCKKEEQEEQITTSYLHGVYVSNEGSFGAVNGGITHIASDGKVTADAYYQANNVTVGDVLQSFAIIGNRGYAVVNNSQKLEVVDLNTMKHVSAINGLSYPRYIIPVDANTAYLTNGSFAGEVVVINLSDNTIAANIPVGNGPEMLTRSGDYVFVCNSGGWAEDNTVSIIDIDSRTVDTTIPVGDRPVDCVTDATGDVWVLCRGKVIYDESWNVVGHTDAAIYRIDGLSHEIEYSSGIGVNGDHPSHLAISNDGQTLYLNNNEILTMPVSGTTWTTLIDGEFNSLDVHPGSGEIWCSGIPNFVSPTPVYKYDPSGVLRATYQAGIGANGVSFN